MDPRSRFKVQIYPLDGKWILRLGSTRRIHAKLIDALSEAELLMTWVDNRQWIRRRYGV